MVSRPSSVGNNDTVAQRHGSILKVLQSSHSIAEPLCPRREGGVHSSCPKNIRVTATRTFPRRAWSEAEPELATSFRRRSSRVRSNTRASLPTSRRRSSRRKSPTPLSSPDDADRSESGPLGDRLVASVCGFLLRRCVARGLCGNPGAARLVAEDSEAETPSEAWLAIGGVLGVASWFRGKAQAVRGCRAMRGVSSRVVEAQPSRRSMTAKKARRFFDRRA